MLVVVSTIALVALFTIPLLARWSARSSRIHCTSNLKQVGMSFRVWMDDHSAYPMRYQTNNFNGPRYAIEQKMFAYLQVMSNELVSPIILVCPSDDRTAAASFALLGNTNISYFLGMDAPDETMPQMFLAGDRNLTTNGTPILSGLALIKSTDTLGWTQKMHQGQGNVALADGSVQGYTSSGFQQAFRHTGTNINRLALP